MYFEFSKNFIYHNFEIFSELQTKILNYQKIKFDWIIKNYSTINEFRENLSKNKNFLNKKATGKVFLNQILMIMASDFDPKKSKFYCFFIFKNYYQFLDKNSIKTLIKYSFFK
jgi:hypothetical protein